MFRSFKEANSGLSTHSLDDGCAYSAGSNPKVFRYFAARRRQYSALEYFMWLDTSLALDCIATHLVTGNVWIASMSGRLFMCSDVDHKFTPKNIEQPRMRSGHTARNTERNPTVPSIRTLRIKEPFEREAITLGVPSRRACRATISPTSSWLDGSSGWVPKIYCNYLTARGRRIHSSPLYFKSHSPQKIFL